LRLDRQLAQVLAVELKQSKAQSAAAWSTLVEVFIRL
jgi:hypothetical protein